MVDIEVWTNRENVLETIDDILVNNIGKSFSDCAEDNDISPDNVEIGDMFVFGSWTRGTATPGESDIDLIIEIINPHGDELSSDFSRIEQAMIGCISQDESRIISGLEDTFDGVDILHTIPENKWVHLNRFTFNTRISGDVKNPRVYDLLKSKYMTRGEIQGKLKDEGKMGGIPPSFR